ncbi:MAG: threonylcarbamoyl-AMP synthase [Hyphomicrobiales bacterium]|nr:threonylcarbamoyl-AMP synthase [Hyphomicrobiales bacterium]
MDNIIAKGVRHLNEGELLAIPTETVYGLAGDATNGTAIARIFAVKLRPKFNPLIAHVSSIEMACEYGEFDEISLELARHFWPGPLTLVVDCRQDSKIHELVSAGLDTIAIRCPGGMARQLIKTFGKPLAAPSANRSGKVSATSASHVTSEFEGENILVLDGGPCSVGIESTIAKVSDSKITLLRSGSITLKQLADFTGLPVEMAAHESAIQAPGMMTSHYAPRSNVLINCTQATDDAAVLTFGLQQITGNVVAQNIRNLSPAGDLLEAASNLYKLMRELDDLGKDTICVAPVPMEGLGIAINDRLTRASAPRSEV